MKNKISQLEPSVSSHLKSQTSITSIVDGFRELIQNCIDAGATRIQAEIDFERLSVTIKDDGCGMSPNDLDHIGQRYYTSKLKYLKDIKHVESFGFRGEALGSLVSLADLLIVSKVADYNGSFSVSFIGGKKKYGSRLIDDDSMFFRAIDTKSGTIVNVNNIFRSVPVRLKQAQKANEAKLLQYIRDVILQCSISKPGCELVVYKCDQIGRKLICKVPREGTENHMIIAMNSIYGLSLNQNYQFLEAKYKEYKVECIVSTLPVQSKLYQHVFYGLRVLKDEQLMKDINRMFLNSGFGDLSTEFLVSSIPKNDVSPKKGTIPTKSATSVGNPFSKYPSFVIKIQGPVSTSDLLQDPSKTIEGSKHLNIVSPLVLKIMRSFLKLNHYNVSKVLFPKLGSDKSTKISGDESDMVSSLALNSRVRMGKLLDKELAGMLTTSKENQYQAPQNELISKNIKRRKMVTKPDTFHNCNHSHAEIQKTEDTDHITKEMLNNLNVISQVDTKFILVKNQNSLYVIDQHACDERIKVEQYLKDFITLVQSPFQDVAVPLESKSFNIVPSQSENELFNLYHKMCQNWGIKYRTGDDGVFVTHLPEIMHAKVDESREFIKRCLLQYLYDLQNNVKFKTLSEDWWLSLQAVPTIIIDLISSKACRSAIMFGKKLAKNECELLIAYLLKCHKPFQCAHGRPSIVPLCDLSKLRT